MPASPLDHGKPFSERRYLIQQASETATTIAATLINLKTTPITNAVNECINTILPVEKQHDMYVHKTATKHVQQQGSLKPSQPTNDLSLPFAYN